MDGLKKCPFCGGSAEMVKTYAFFDYSSYYIKCSCCGASVPITATGIYMQYNGERNVTVTDKMIIDRIITTWNNRVIS
ncbi:MAG: Lar family restriction alleviation protein [Oscillospiraceae bacterium]|nr:Lar family restriction alleviation protein [Oscillospiraceae bacterium]